jgi:arsenate reductase
MITLYGIPNCDTVKRARQRLDETGIAYRFHDFRRDGLEPALARHWLQQLGADTVLNRRGTSWRALPDADKTDLDTARATALVVAHPSIVKRPLFDRDGALRVGFAKAEEDAVLAWLRG